MLGVPWAPGVALGIFPCFFSRAAAASCAPCAFGLSRGADATFLAVRRAAAPPRAVGLRGLEVGRRVALPILLLLFAVLPLFFL